MKSFLERAKIIAIKKLNGYIQVARLAKPIVQQLKSSAIDIARAENDVLVTEEVAESGINGSHAGVKVPSHVLGRKRPAFNVHNMVGQRNRGGIEQARIDLEQGLTSLKGIINPFGAGIEIGGRARDHGCRGKDRGHIIEKGIGTLGNAAGLAFD